MSPTSSLFSRSTAEEKCFAVLPSRKIRSPSQPVPNLYTHFDLEDSLWEDEGDDCDLTSFSSLIFLLSWSLSASPYYCSITANYYKHNCTDKIEKNMQQGQWEQSDFWKLLNTHRNLISIYTVYGRGGGGEGSGPSRFDVICTETDLYMRKD